MIDELNIQDSAGRSRAAWRLIEKITGRHKRPYAVVSADSLEDRLQRYQSFFQSILDPPEPDISQVLSPLNTQHGVFNCEEITPPPLNSQKPVSLPLLAKLLVLMDSLRTLCVLLHC